MKLWVEKGAYLDSHAHQIAKNIHAQNKLNILVIRHAALGDMLQTRPFLVELRKCFPNSHITLSLISNYQYAAPTDLVDSIHVLEGSDRRDVSLIQRVKNFFSLNHFDILFDLACTSRSKILTLCTKAKLKLSFPYSKNLWLYNINIHRSDFRFEAENLLEFLFLFGHQPDYPINYALQKNLSSKFSHEIVLFFGASNPNRCYPLEYWKKLLPMLATNFPEFQWCILQGHQNNEDYFEFFTNLNAHNKNIIYQKKLGLSELSEKITNCKCIISNDTGIRHLAIAHETPTVGFFYNTCPGRNLPTYDAKHLILLNQEEGHLSPEDSFNKISTFVSKYL